MNKFYIPVRFIALLFFIQITNKEIVAQTNPTPQSLPYSQFWNTLAAGSNIYPAGWQGWSIPVGTATVFTTAAATADFPLIASSNASITTAGIHNYNGAVGILADGTTSAFTNNPALCLAINTTGVSSVQVNYNLATIRNPFAAATNNRINQVDLQFRVGTSGAFTSIGNSGALYQNNQTLQTGTVTTQQNLQGKVVTLPASCNNQPVVQLRWVQRDLTGTIGANRPSFAVDNVVICSSLFTPTISISGPTAFCTGNTATYTSTITNGGSAPAYQWKKNGTIVGTSSSVTLSGLLVGDQITCTLTTNLTCVTSLTANSNSITIGTVNSSPIITGAVITEVTCPGARDGSINISVSGGTPPYSICWDTVNISNGPMYGVTVGGKTATHPFPGGIGVSFYIDGTDGKELILTKGITYSFNTNTPGHPFQISTDSLGGNTNFIVVNGQTNGAPPSGVGTVTFRPNNTHPQTLYYPCAFHQWMGGRIRVRDGYCVEDPTNLRAGIYSVVVSDANGCTANAQYTVNELPTPISLTADVTDAICNNTGSIDLHINGGTPPYQVLWDTLNTTNGNLFSVMVGNKTASNPYFNLGNPTCFFINGNEAPALRLVRGIDYIFNVLSIGHPWHISTDSVGASSANLVTSGQSGAPNDNGTVTFTPNNSHPSLLRYICANHQYMGYKVHIFNGYAIEDPVNLNAGIYSVVVTDATGCFTTSTFSIGQNPYPINADINATTDATCFGLADGTLDVNPTDGFSPYSVSGTGPTFMIIAQAKNHAHPQFGTGSANGYAIDGVQGKELTLIRGITYSFSVLAPGHPFFISTSIAGGPANLGSEVTHGVTNSMVTNGTLTFTPDDTHPALLYYQCAAHSNMGWKINIVDQGVDGDLQNCMAGNYNLVVNDVNKCTAQHSLSFTINEPIATVFYYDGDGDFYGNTSESALACNAPTGFVSVDGDCNDAAPAVHPGATEICNGIDDDCNGLVDINDPGISGIVDWYRDADTDGYGNTSDHLHTCSPPPGYISVSGDCNDNAASIHPGATELCNGIDDNCNTLIDDGVVCSTSLHLTLFIQGYYLGGHQMAAVADAIGQPSICDTVTVLLASAVSPYSIVYQVKGTIGTDGNGVFVFPLSAAGGNYFIVIRHRNSIETWSGSAFTISNDMVYNFSSSATQAFGGNLAQLEAGVYGLWSGDVNQDGQINLTDLMLIQNGTQLFETGYVSEDINGDNLSETSDYSLIENNLVFIIGAMRP